MGSECVCHSIWPFVCLLSCFVCLLSCFLPQGGQKAIPTAVVLDWLDFNSGDFHKSATLKVYGVKQERKSQYANTCKYCLTLASLCRFAHWKYQKLLKGKVVSQRLHSSATY